MLTLPLNSEIDNMFYSLYNQWELVQKESNLQSMAIFYNILATIQKHSTISDNLNDKLLYDSVSYMNEHFRESDFNISQLYETTYISEAYFRRIFKQVYGVSPLKYLKNLRLNYAKQLLFNGYYTISEVAELSGFTSVSYFSYEFKRQTGYAPSGYQND